MIIDVAMLLPVLMEARTVLNSGNPDAKRLYDDLLSNYNKLVRPVVNTTDPLTVRIKLKLSQLIDVVSAWPWGARLLAGKIASGDIHGRWQI